MTTWADVFTGGPFTTEEQEQFDKLKLDLLRHHWDAVILGDPDADTRPSGIIAAG